MLTEISGFLNNSSVLNSSLVAPDWNKPLRSISVVSTRSHCSISNLSPPSRLPLQKNGTAKRECFQPIRESFSTSAHQPEKSKCLLLLRLFRSVSRPGGVSDAGPLDFSGVYRLLWGRWIKHAFGICLIKEEREMVFMQFTIFKI